MHAHCRGRLAVDPPFSQRENGNVQAHGTALFVEWGWEFCASRRVDEYVDPYSGVYHSSECYRESVVAGG